MLSMKFRLARATSKFWAIIKKEAKASFLYLNYLVGVNEVRVFDVIKLYKIFNRCVIPPCDAPKRIARFYAVCQITLV